VYKNLSEHNKISEGTKIGGTAPEFPPVATGLLLQRRSQENECQKWGCAINQGRRNKHVCW